ncbi:putative DNA replication licensing factor [Tilletiaria anomala UBC 951]|uniref:DNA replication licensing factor MCM7 n=1 Tax=Tilletiaria anomala (strain ATCC 24038 / CBS 436.72 / UBC 951) TaxID=1037660 RepID=A0A066VLQ2_TILAU|nr:putative DNA replication licensing factor [Tilletiaria anomala UBC 951]KDN39694.1 putative DNA replication licensing factor [Tilletiaria anomala UBC 951]
MATNGILPVININVNYEEEKEKISQFLTAFQCDRSVLNRYDSKGALVSQVRSESASPGLENDVDGLNVRDEAEHSAEDSENDEDERALWNSSHPDLTFASSQQRIANRDLDTLVIDLNDLASFSANGQKTFGAELVQSIKANTRRYVSLFCNVVDRLLEEKVFPTKDISDKDDVLDVIMAQRRAQNEKDRDQRRREREGMMGNTAGDADDLEGAEEEVKFPPVLLRRYDLYFAPQRHDKPLAVRQVHGSHLGKFITVRGIITRVSEVKPFLQVEAVACDVCGAEIFTEVMGRQYIPTEFCTSRTCTTNKVKSPVFPQNRASKFVPFQEVKIQEMADQVPVGHIPRTMTIHLNGTLTRALSPGDVVETGGIFLPMPYSGFKAIRAGLLTDTFLEAHNVHQLKKQYEAMELTPEIRQRISDLKGDPALYNKLASSIAPEIYGHEDVKKALLLLLVGGVTKNIADGMRIRGDINICLMGDPGVAKSQLLKYISKVAPRGVYTTGRGSSGVGLTAAVMRDPVTEEMVLEGGALVLADNGIACIDEFDKMDESDRTAIHEVMEQQTISISKAGITTTLNARTSILAAANPLYGRYNPRISPVDNINLPAALLSRFDILFLILDTPARDDDERLAQHVTYVHMFNEHPELSVEPLDPILMRHYIALARQKRPVISKAVSDYVVGSYVKLRGQHKEDEARDQAFTYTSARTLLGILRLSQALARLRFDDIVDVADVDEALRLMEVSKASLHHSGRGHEGVGQDHSHLSKIYRIIREMAFAAGEAEADDYTSSSKSQRFGHGPDGERGGDAMDLDEVDDRLPAANKKQKGSTTAGLGELDMRDVRDRIIASGWVEDQLTDCLEEYSDLGVIQITDDQKLIFL